MKLRVFLHGARDGLIVGTVYAAVMLHPVAIVSAVFALLAHFALQESKRNEQRD